MARRWALLLLLLTSGALLSQDGAAPHTWRVYTNVRFQYSVCYPANLLIPQGEAENSDGQKFLAKDGAQLLVYGRHNALDQTLKEILEDTATRLAGPSGKTTYRVVRNGWFVVSGENKQTTFYAKTFLVNDQVKSFELTYPAARSSVYKPVVTRLASCFKMLGP